MLLLKTGPVVITGYREGTKTENGQQVPMTRGDGSVIEFVRYRSEGDLRDRDTVLDRRVNGSRPKVGALVSITLESRQEPVNNPGGQYVKWAEKARAVDFEAVSAA